MSAISEIRAKAAEKYPAYTLDLDTGESVTLKSIMELDDKALADFSETQKRLTELETSEDLAGLRTEFVTALAQVSDNPTAVRENLSKETLGVVAVLFEEYTASLNDASKSKGTE